MKLIAAERFIYVGISEISVGKVQNFILKTVTKELG
jgi:hypothetical protein